MVFRVCAFGFVIIVLGISVSTCSYYAETEACEAVFNPDALKISCCPPMNQYVEQIAQCKKKCNTEEFSCSVSDCLAKVYDLTTNDTIDDAKIRSLLKRLTMENPASKPLNDEIEQNCLNRQYKKYTASETECDKKTYLVCANVHYLMGCQKFNKSPCSCKTLAENVKTCKPFLQQYLKQINTNKC